MSGQVVDTPTAEEFMREILEKVSENELAAIAGDLEGKSRRFRDSLTTGEPNGDDLRNVLGSIFSARRKAGAIIEVVGERRLSEEIAHLLATREFDRMDDLLSGFPGAAFDLPGELLHFTDPGRWWLWTRWMWDPRTKTGALPLVTMEEIDLTAPTRAETYLKIGRAVAFVNETGKAAGFTSMGEGLFGIDVFLASVYAIYMYTVLRLRMTNEFNRVVPPLPELVRRLLGVYKCP